jgi:predicted HAD superfamily Cof-like phosphohydrolase
MTAAYLKSNGPVWPPINMKSGNTITISGLTKEGPVLAFANSPMIVDDVKEFYEHFNIPSPVAPEFNLKSLEFRLRFLKEEVGELERAIANKDLVEVSDAFLDILYVVTGACHESGLPVKELWDEVHRTNMLKEPSDPDKSWKRCMKPPGWTPPKIKKVLVAAGWNQEVVS